MRFWARNETRALKKEGEDEKVVAWSRIIREAKYLDRTEYEALIAEGRSVLPVQTKYREALTKVHAEARAAGAKYSKYFLRSDVEHFLDVLLSFPSHFRPTKLFKPTFLTSLTESHGGVSDKLFYCPFHG